jgi:phage terminase large subunit-like protein
MKHTLIAAVLAASFSAGASASDYFVVVPVPNRAPTDGNIVVSLNGYTLPTGVVGRAYAGFDFNSVLQVKGDPGFNPANVRWSVASGALPSGLSLGTDGKLTGTPTASATSSFQILAAYKSKAGQQGYQVFIADISIRLAADAGLPAGVQGAAYSYDLKPRLTVSGDPQYTPAQVSWSVASGELPSGLQLNQDGTITGVPDAEGTYPFTIKASYLNRAGQQGYQVMVGAISVSLTGATLPALPAGTAMAAYDLKQKLSIAGDAAYAHDGSGVSWAVTGALPAGLALGPDGLITGTPTLAGTSSFSVTASYKAKVSAPATYNMSVTANVRNNGSARSWSDGTYAASCQGYLHPTGLYSYTGATGDGVYTIDPDGAGAQAPLNVYCDMTSDGGGWMLFSNIYRDASGALNLMTGTNQAATLSPVSGSGSIGGTQGLNSFQTFPFTTTRIEFIAGDNPGQIATFYKGLTRANMASWAVVGAVEPDTSKAAVCTDYAMTQNCTSRPFDHDYNNNGSATNFSMFWGVTVAKYGYTLINYQPAHGVVFTTGGSGWCSTTGNANNNAWNDSSGDGHWGNGMRIWVK